VRPSETGLIEDAAAAYAFAIARYPAERIVLWGESVRLFMKDQFRSDLRISKIGLIERPIAR